MSTKLSALSLLLTACTSYVPSDDAFDGSEVRRSQHADAGGDDAATSGAATVDDGVVPEAGVALAPDLPAVDPATCLSSAQGAAAEAACYLCRTLCAGQTLPEACAVQVAWSAPQSACLEHDPEYPDATGVAVPSYRFRAAPGEPVEPRSAEQQLGPTMLLPWLTHLRALAGKASWLQVLRNQVHYALSRARSFEASPEVEASLGWESFYQRPSGEIRRNLHGSSTAGFARVVLGLAHDDDAYRTQWLTQAALLDATLERGSGPHEGGVRAVQPACGPAGLVGSCTYFHSRAPQNAFLPGTALHQSLAVLTAAAASLAELARWSDADWPADAPLPRAAWMLRLQERLAAGLTQWTYGGAGPTLQASRRPLQTAAGRPFFWSHYDFDPGAGVGRTDVDAAQSCLAHTETLHQLAVLTRVLDPARAAEPDNVSAALGASAERIAAARAVLSTSSRAGAPEATGAADGHALVQWFRAELDADARSAVGCAALSPLGGADRAYFCEIFGGCEAVE